MSMVSLVVLMILDRGGSGGKGAREEEAIGPVLVVVRGGYNPFLAKRTGDQRQLDAWRLGEAEYSESSAASVVATVFVYSYETDMSEGSSHEFLASPPFRFSLFFLFFFNLS